ncbi:hypothetical protein VTN49DRAFT_2039 [Thermomyces lanuginosus]|uniref:uncharacterized protein n=1 Tax=Thermomyces lanuginosus TaxID=5541 RepID=UPI00374442D0
MLRGTCRCHWQVEDGPGVSFLSSLLNNQQQFVQSRKHRSASCLIQASYRSVDKSLTTYHSPCRPVIAAAAPESATPAPAARARIALINLPNTGLLAWQWLRLMAWAKGREDHGIIRLEI